LIAHKNLPHSNHQPTNSSYKIKQCFSNQRN
jgi:hypothetical protein